MYRSPAARATSRRDPGLLSGGPAQKSGRRRAPIGAGRRPLFLIRVKSGRRQDAIMTSATSGFRHTKKIIGAYRRPLCKKKVADVPAIKVFRGSGRAAGWGSERRESRIHRARRGMGDGGMGGSYDSREGHHPPSGDQVLIKYLSAGSSYEVQRSQHTE